ncbi:COP9 signalosome complex subunit 7 [Dirofilaria immitis]|nr:COP9 signalosome complex subunit 7 [Dirofilaria immitis]
MVEVYLNNFRKATNAEEIARQICSIVEASDIHAFAQFLAEPSIKALKNDPNYYKYYNLLHLFSYGTYNDTITRKNELPELSETMLRKIRQLTLVTMCTHSKIFPIEDAMRELQITDLQAFQRLFISAVYDGIIQGRLNAQKSEIEVFSWKNRDIADDELDDICQELHKWIQRCIDIKEDLSRVAKSTEKAIAEANERENKENLGCQDSLYIFRHYVFSCNFHCSESVIFTALNPFFVAEEAKKVQKMLEEEEEQRMPKEFYRRTKTQRGKKHC